MLLKKRLDNAKADVFSKGYKYKELTKLEEFGLEE